MFKSLKDFLGVFILIGLSSYSCNYRYYTFRDDSGRTFRDENGRKHYLRDYNTIEREQKYNHKIEIKCSYQSQKFTIDSNCFSKTDSTVECDSMKITILSDSKQYAKIFTKGLISCKMISHLFPDDRLHVIDLRTNKEVIPEVQRDAYIHSVSPIRYIKTGKNRRLFMFRIEAYTFYFELTNDNANKKINMDEFINGAILTWLYKSNIVEI